VLRIELTGWEEARDRASQVRHEVFVDEQGVPRELELDARDALCVHALAFDGNGAVVGTGRLLPAVEEAGRLTGHIGRMAVRRSQRGRGIGGAILERLINAARDRGDQRIVLSAQTHALEFYRAHGFTPVGENYIEAGIEHRDMRREI